MATYVDLTSKTYPAGVQALLNSLNEYQQRVASYQSGLVIVSGTPGAGKTATLVALVARLVSDGVPPNRILCMTFTKNAAGEMEKRIEATGVHGARVGTIHSVAYEVLRSCQFMNATIDDKSRLVIELEKTLVNMRKTKVLPRWADESGPFREYIAYCKSRGAVILADDRLNTNCVLESCAAKLSKAYVDALDGGELRPQQFLQVYQDYEKRRSAAGLLDFDDMLSWAWLVLARDPYLRQAWRQRWQYVLVDESQDSSPLQWDIARFFVGLPSCTLGRYLDVPDSWQIPEETDVGNLISLGDLAQAIYAFRGAEPMLLLEMSQRKDVEVLPLPINYRSTPGICAAGSMLIEGKTWNVSGTMIPGGPLSSWSTESTYPTVQEFPTPEAEAEACLTWAQGRGQPYNDSVIMSRTALGLYAIELECLRRRVPYRKRASYSIFDTKEVKDLLAYLRVAACTDQTGTALKRIINTPFRYISSRFIDNCIAEAGSRGEALLDVLMRESYSLNRMQQIALRDLKNLLLGLNRMAVEQDFRGPAAMIGEVLTKTAFLDEVRSRQGMTDETSRIELIYEIQRIAEMFRSPIEFLQYIDQLSAAVRSAGAAKMKVGETADKDALTLSTIHGMKGLQARRIWIAGVVPGRHPHTLAKDSDEELRLMYVAVTRAMEECIVSCYPARVAGYSPYITRLLALRGEDEQTVEKQEDAAAAD